MGFCGERGVQADWVLVGSGEFWWGVAGVQADWVLVGSGEFWWGAFSLLEPIRTYQNLSVFFCVHFVHFVRFVRSVRFVRFVRPARLTH